MALKAEGAVVLRGNHDAAIATPDLAMNSLARAAIDWTRPRLDAEAKAFLAALPMTYEMEGMLFVHADASAPSRWNYVVDTASAHASLGPATTAHLTVCGHVHRPQLYCFTATAKVVRHQPEIGASIPLAPHRRWLAVVGAVGQPRDGNPAAGFALVDTSAREITYLRAHDHEAAASKVRAAGLPEQLALRLEAGL